MGKGGLKESIYHNINSRDMKDKELGMLHWLLINYFNYFAQDIITSAMSGVSPL